MSTGGTAKALAGGGLPVIGISDVTGFPEMMDGRVKTLHPKVHGGILARRHRAGRPARRSATHGITPIDLVVVNLYPFAEAAARPASAVRRPRRGDRHRRAEPGPGGRQELPRRARRRRPGRLRRACSRRLTSPAGPTLSFRFDLARRAFAHTAAYDQMIATTLDDVRVDEAGGEFTRGAGAQRSFCRRSGSRV